MLPSTIAYSSEIKPITRIDFSLLSSDEVRRSAVVTVSSSRLVQPVHIGTSIGGSNQPSVSSGLHGTLYDPRFGTIERLTRCATCNLSETECPGHRGVILLDEPIFYPPTLASNEVLKVLRTLCFVCRDVLIDDNWIRLHRLNELVGLRRWNTISVMLKDSPIRCRRCQTPQLDFRVDEYRVFAYAQEKRFRVTVPRKPRAKTAGTALGTAPTTPPPPITPDAPGASFKQEVSARQLLEMLGVLTGADHTRDMDTTRSVAWQQLTGCPESPINMVMTAVGVLELRNRPYVIMNNGLTHDDLTFKYSEIVKTNDKIRKLLGRAPPVRPSGSKRKGVEQPSEPSTPTTEPPPPTPPPQTVVSHAQRDMLRDFTAQLFGHVRTLYHNKNRQSKNPHTQTPTKDFQKRLDTKSGRVRGNLSGKRVNFSTRAPISPDSSLDADVVRMPPAIARVLTFPMHVTSMNMAKANELMAKGKVNFVIRPQKPVVKNDKSMDQLNPLPPQPKWFDMQAMRKPRYSKVMDPASFQLMIGDVIHGGPLVNKHLQTDNDVRTHVLKINERVIRAMAIVFPIELTPPRNEQAHWAKHAPNEIFRSAELRCAVRREPPREFPLKVGDVIERQYETGMSIFFNRQPTLHMGSMLERKVVVDENDPWMTLRFNLSGTDSFNADMDGDEMTAWVPQSIASVAELVCCAGTEAVVKTPEDGRLLQVLKQDALTGGYLLTVGHKHGYPLARADFFQCTMLVPRWTLEWVALRLNAYANEVLGLNLPTTQILNIGDLPEQVFTGHALLSLLFPVSFTFESGKLQIRRGLIYSGVFNKSVLSEHRGSMLHLYESLYGARPVIEWISAYQILVVKRLGLFGFSIGMKDTELVGSSVQSVIESDKRTSWIEAREAWIANDRISELRISTALNNIKALGEKVTMQFLQTQESQSQSVQSNSNGIITAIASGAKGSFANVASMTVMVGQQNLEGRRMPMTFGGELGDRTLPCYLGEQMYRDIVNESDDIFDRVLESRGRVVSPYRKGLSPQEYFFCAMGGREGMIETGKSGYLQRRLVKKAEDIHINVSGCLANAHGEVVSFTHLDGWNPALIEQVPIDGSNIKVRCGVDLKRMFQQQVAQQHSSKEERNASMAVFGTFRPGVEV